MSILNESNLFFGVNQGGHFIGEGSVYCCDSFSVDPKIENDRLIFNVIFHTPTGPQSFEWCLHSLSHLSKPYVLSDVLLSHGVRCSSSPKTAVTILNAIQNSYTKKETLQ